MNNLIGIREKWHCVRQLTSFAVVGTLAGVLDYAAMVLAIEWFWVDAVAAALAGYLIGAITSYLLNRAQTFRSNRPHQQAVWRFVTVGGIGFFLTGLLMDTMVHIFQMSYFPSRLVTMLAVSAGNFVAYKYWAFKS